MNRYEKEEIKELPSKYRPIGAWAYLGYTILFGIPLIGFIAWLVCALSSSNINRRSFARMYFCVFLIALIIVAIVVVIAIVAGGGVDALMAKIQEILASMKR